MKSRPRKSAVGKHRSARLGALILVGAFVVALVATISTGSCAAQRYRRGNLLSLVTGNQTYGQERLTTCGFVRGITPVAFDAVPCQFWNLMLLTGLAFMAGGWLVLDLIGLDRRRRQ